MKCTYNYHMDDCSESMTLGLADVSYMSVFNDFDETDRDMSHGRIVDDFSMLTVDSTTAVNNESTLGTGTKDLGNYTLPHTNLYSGQVERAFGLLGNSINTINITANISGSNCGHNPVLRMNYFLIVTLRRVLMMKLILIGTPVWLRMNLSH